MIGGVATAGEQTKLRSNGQWSKGYVAGLEMPKIVLQARINQTFPSLDRVGQITFDTVTAGSYLDVLPEMTVWIGTSAGACDVGIARVRKAGSSTVLFIGETSELALADDQYITVLDEFLPWPIHMHVDDGTFADYDNAYTDQHENYEPVPVMGADVVAVLEDVIDTITVTALGGLPTFTGSWTNEAHGKFSSTTGDKASYTFTGRRVKVHAVQADNQGVATIKLDGNVVATVDGYNSVLDWDVEVYDSGDLVGGSHTIEFVVTGTKNALSTGYYCELISFVYEQDATEVTVNRDASDSWVFDGTITGYTWSAPGAHSTSGLATATPSFTYRTAGTYHIFCTVEADNGKTKKGVRTIYVVGTPVPCRWRNAQVDLSDGGASFDVELYTGVDQATVRDRARCILWTEDWFGGVKGSIGVEEGNEHILMGGWVTGDSIQVDVDGGAVRFSVKGANWWLNKMDGFAPVLNLATNTPSRWDEMAGMTVDRGVWHLLAVRSNITTLMDVRLTGDTNLVKKLDSSAGSLWDLISNFADRNFSIPFVDGLGRFWLRVDPQMVPESDRSAWPTVMTLTSADLQNDWDIKRVTAKDTSQIDLSGIACDNSGREKSYYSLSYGHIPGREGGGMQADKFVISGQVQLNQLAGLLDGWRNNEYPDIELRLPSNFRVMDLVPHQYVALDVAAQENPRGVALSFNLIPRGIRFSYDEEAGCIETVLEAEAETFELNSCNGDIPGIDEDLSEPPSGPPPTAPPLLPGTNTGLRPKKVLIKERTRGLLYTENGDAEDPADIQWQFVNGGLDTNHKGTAMTRILVTNYGRIYLGYYSPSEAVWNEIWYAASIGGVFTRLIDTDWIKSALGVTTGYTVELDALGMNALADDQIGFAVLKTKIGWPLTDEGYIYTGNAGGFTKGAHLTEVNKSRGSLSYGAGLWVLTGQKRTIFWHPALWTINGSTISAPTDLTAGAAEPTLHHRAGSSGTLFVVHGAVFEYVTGNGATIDETGHSGVTFSVNENYLAVDPTGQYLMAADGSASASYKSSDYGYTWSSLGAVLPLGTKAFGWGLYSTQRWAAAGGSVYFTSDFGTTWTNMDGNLGYVCPLPNIDFIKVIE
jgi:hypothetical protein